MNTLGLTESTRKVPPMADVVENATPEMIAAAWATWHERHGGKLGPGPAFVEAINAALRARLSQAGAGGVVGRRAVAMICMEIGEDRDPDNVAEMFRVFENAEHGTLQKCPYGCGRCDVDRAYAQADRILAALAPSPSAGEPTGWKLVPVEPDARMHAAGSSVLAAGQGQVWQAMLDHAPTPPATPVQPTASVTIDLATAIIVRNVFLPRNPNKLRGAHPDTVAAAHAFNSEVERRARQEGQDV